ncbi:ABC transporter ATP-binding protein [Sphaerisporangium corydalis]|uniref:ABC transporter ATP-binding protein n=1 Tax=Sphaerisporangium corydalis TaxID=1441875 RepID=A0ABV9E9Y1_9ACTN|nr:ABC transporter ATP-binding protein [Sphaerisporangium corydalis]
MIASLRRRDEWRFFGELPQAGRGLAAAWFGLILLRGLIPAVFVVFVGLLVDAVRRGAPITALLLTLGVLFVVLQVLAPAHGQVSANLGDRLTGWLNDRLLASTAEPAGLGHLESPELTDDLTLARDFELGLSGPPMSLAMSLIAGGLVDLVAGFCQAVVLAAYRWWAPLLVGGAWLSTHWLLRRSTVWDRMTGEVLDAQRYVEYSYRLAMDTPAAKEVRLFGLAGWVVDRFAASRRRLVDIRLRSTRLHRRWILLTVALVAGANAVFFWSLAQDAAAGGLGPAATIAFAQAAVGASALAFGGLNWALPHAAEAVMTVRRLEPAMRKAGALTGGERPAGRMPATEIRFRGVGFSYAPGSAEVLDGLDLVVPAGSSLAVVGANGAGKTTLVKLLCRLYDPTAGRIEVDGVDLRELDPASWRGRVTAIFQDYVKYDLPLRENVAPLGGDDDDVRAALAGAGAERVAGLDTVLAAGYDGGVDLSGGQWQRVALARVLHAVRGGAGVVILDEPTAQLDVRGEAEIFQRLLSATKGRTTILISHRFSTVRHADRICVLEEGRVVESGTHDSLMAAGGRYRTMFTLQAARFGDEEEPDVRLRT